MLLVETVTTQPEAFFAEITWQYGEVIPWRKATGIGECEAKARYGVADQCQVMTISSL